MMILVNIEILIIKKLINKNKYCHKSNKKYIYKIRIHFIFSLKSLTAFLKHLAKCLESFIEEKSRTIS